MMIGIGVESDSMAYRFNDQVMTELEIGPDDISNIIAQFASNMQKVEKLFNIV